MGRKGRAGAALGDPTQGWQPSCWWQELGPGALLPFRVVCLTGLCSGPDTRGAAPRRELQDEQRGVGGDGVRQHFFLPLLPKEV